MPDQFANALAGFEVPDVDPRIRTTRSEETTILTDGGRQCIGRGHDLRGDAAVGPGIDEFNFRRELLECDDLRAVGVIRANARLRTGRLQPDAVLLRSAGQIVK